MEITEFQTSRWLRYNLPILGLEAAMDSVVKLLAHQRRRGFHDNFSGKRTFTLKKVVNGVNAGLVSGEQVVGHDYIFTIAFDPPRVLDEHIRTDEIGQVDGSALQIGFFHDHSPHDTVKIAGLSLFTGQWSLLSSGDAKMQLKEGEDVPPPTYTVELEFPGFLRPRKDKTVIGELRDLSDKLYLPKRASDGSFVLNSENSSSQGGLAYIQLRKAFKGEFGAAAEGKVASLYEAVKDIALRKRVIVNAPMTSGYTLAQYEGDGLEEMVRSSQPQMSYSGAAINVQIGVRLPHIHKGQTVVPLTELHILGATKPTPRQIDETKKYDTEHPEFAELPGGRSKSFELQRVV